MTSIIVFVHLQMITTMMMVDNIVAGVEEAHGIAVRPVKGIPEYMLEEDKYVMENLVVVI